MARVLGRLPPEARDQHLLLQDKQISSLREWGVLDEVTEHPPKVLLASGFGYGNVGDEAQLGACIRRWKRAAPEVQITLLSPNPPYTRALHGQRVEWATRIAWFRSNTTGPYWDERRFPAVFRRLHWRMEVSARLFRGEVPLMTCLPREARVLQLLQEHDILHISGGGFLTGKTRSRLWDNCLLMRMCKLLGKPYFLTGHTIGIFRDRADRRIARLGLRDAKLIGLRDRGISERALAEIGIVGSHIESTCDDALFCDRINPDEVRARLADAGVPSGRSWVAVNAHYWGQDTEERDRIASRCAVICDEIQRRHGYHVVFIAMTPSDVEPENDVAAKMSGPSACLSYSSDYRVVRGVIADAALVFTMKHHPIVFAQGEGVPVVSVAFDDYYLHKNKGALANTGDDEFLADREAFFGGHVLNQIEKAVSESQEIRQRMSRWTDAMRKIELRPYRQALGWLGPSRTQAVVESARIGG